MSNSRHAPDGDVRLTANIRKVLHLKLKMAAVMYGITIGELIEKFIEHQLDEMLKKGMK